MQTFHDADLSSLAHQSAALDDHRLAGVQAYLSIALENTAYFRVMFELPGVPRLANALPEPSGVSLVGERPFMLGLAVLKRAVAERAHDIPGGAEEGVFVGWSLAHGIVMLYLSGRFGSEVADRESVGRMTDSARESLYEGWKWRRDPASPNASASNSNERSRSAAS